MPQSWVENCTEKCGDHVKSVWMSITTPLGRTMNTLYRIPTHSYCSSSFSVWITNMTWGRGGDISWCRPGARFAQSQSPVLETAYTNASPSCTIVNRLTPNDPYMGRTAPITSKSCILYIYSTNIDTEYFKHALYSPVFSLQNVVCFIMLTCLVPVLFTFYIQSVLKF